MAPALLTWMGQPCALRRYPGLREYAFCGYPNLLWADCACPKKREFFAGGGSLPRTPSRDRVTGETEIRDRRGQSYETGEEHNTTRKPMW